MLQPFQSALTLCCALLLSYPAGKTHIGLRLAQLYGLPHINTATILAELQHMDAETQKVGLHAHISHDI